MNEREQFLLILPNFIKSVILIKIHGYSFRREGKMSFYVHFYNYRIGFGLYGEIIDPKTNTKQMEINECKIGLDIFSHINLI